MEEYRKAQTERWRRIREQAQPPEETSEPRVPRQEIPSEPSKPVPEVTTMVVDGTSLSSLRNYVRDTKEHRFGILYGVREGTTVTVDAIYEPPQHEGRPLPVDSRAGIVDRVSRLMGMNPVGFLMTTEMSGENLKNDALCGFETGFNLLTLTYPLFTVVKSGSGGERLAREHQHVAIVLSMEGPDQEAIACCLKDDPIALADTGDLTASSTLRGRTISGGIDGRKFLRKIELITRGLNEVIHTGFYRINRANHTPTPGDVVSFLKARRTEAGFKDLHQQVADYHLVLYLATILGELTAERVILSIFQRDDELVSEVVAMFIQEEQPIIPS